MPKTSQHQRECRTATWLSVVSPNSRRNRRQAEAGGNSVAVYNRYELTRLDLAPTATGDIPEPLLHRSGRGAFRVRAATETHLPEIRLA
jgi:hypothetical protein